jgi:hypothetical protein
MFQNSKGFRIKQSIVQKVVIVAGRAVNVSPHNRRKRVKGHLTLAYPCTFGSACMLAWSAVERKLGDGSGRVFTCLVGKLAFLDGSGGGAEEQRAARSGFHVGGKELSES